MAKLFPLAAQPNAKRYPGAADQSDDRAGQSGEAEPKGLPIKCLDDRRNHDGRRGSNAVFIFRPNLQLIFSGGQPLPQLKYFLLVILHGELPFAIERIVIDDLLGRAK